MNKLVLKGDRLLLDKYNNNLDIEVVKDSTLDIVNINKDNYLNIKVLDNVKLVINIFDVSYMVNHNIDVTLMDESKLIINASFISSDEYKLNVNTKLYGNNIDAIVNAAGINEENGRCSIIFNSTVAGETKGSNLIEKAKIINKSKYDNVLVPNMCVNTNEVNANHGVSISNINEDEIFYLMCKGISRDLSIKLIEEGFIKGHMDDEMIKRCEKLIIGR